MEKIGLFYIYIHYARTRARYINDIDIYRGCAGVFPALGSFFNKS